MADGTQIWKIVHNGVDTHAIHWHMFNVQIINRVGWDGAIRPPDANELGWKETVRMNPLEIAIVALRPIIPTLPFKVPNSIRPMDVTQPLGSTMNFFNVDPTNQPAVITNALVNFGWEYVWHCHLLGHEENDMMRPMAVVVAPDAPLTVTATLINTPFAVRLTWIDNSANETSFDIQRATDISFTTNVVPMTVAGSNPGSKYGETMVYTDTSVTGIHTYYYRVKAANTVGYLQTYAAPAVGYPQMTAYSAPSVSASVLVVFKAFWAFIIG
jgi:hypothetical protein